MLIATAVLLFFIAAGHLLIEAIDIRLEAFQLAGGIVLFIFAMTMIFGEGKPAREQEQVDGTNASLAVDNSLRAIDSYFGINPVL